MYFFIISSLRNSILTLQSSQASLSLYTGQFLLMPLLPTQMNLGDPLILQPTLGLENEGN